MTKKVTRLHDNFQPEHYSLHLTLDESSMTFSGTVTIRGQKTGRPSQRLTFHQKGLKVSAAEVSKFDKKGEHRIAIQRINNQNSFDEVRLHAAEMIYPGAYSVTMKFKGQITRPMNGIYPCTFKHNGQDKVLIATQFESHHAREAFPCIDEPAAKASFELKLTTPAKNSRTVLSNTPVADQTVTAEQKTTVFETTPRMSTYLLAFAYGELDCLEATTKDGVLVRTFATPDNVKHTEFALDVAVKCLEFYNDYFAIAYPLPKCDFLALPDFASGAMENWGCITFREQALLYDPDNTSLSLKQYIANVVAHELTHQWFGNLVTMRWWTDLWLNESFASWMSYLAVDHLFPEWQVWTQFIVDEQGLALKQDALENTHPIQVAINHPDEIRTIFDAISYEKGASVLHMLHSYLGADDFRNGLRLYLELHAYKNTDALDLWEAWERASGKPVRDFMEAWLTQSGYPIVRANVGSAKVDLMQERYYVNPAANRSAAAKAWPLPLKPNLPLAIELFDKPSASVSLTDPAQTQPLLLNQGRTGFYRLSYDAAHLEKLAKQVATKKMAELDRMGLLSDAFEAAKAGHATSLDALRLLESYASEDSVIVWEVIAGGLGSIRQVMDDESLRDAMRPFVRRLVSEQLARLGWEERPGDSHFDKLLRPIILGLASFGDEPTVVDEARRRFDAMKRPEDIHPDLRGLIYGTIARLGGPADFDKMLKMHDDSSSSEERVTLAAALTNFKQPALIKRALAQIDGPNVRLQDAPYWIAYSFTNPYARAKTWDWLTSHWGWLETNLGSDLSFFRMPNYAARAYSDAAFLPVYKEFFGSVLTPAFERPFKQGIETIEWQAAWRKRDLSALKRYFLS